VMTLSVVVVVYLMSPSQKSQVEPGGSVWCSFERWKVERIYRFI
jgi:hypothetical protein